LKESIKWLNENLAPWELVFHHWSITYDMRHKDLSNAEEKTLCNLVNKWSILKHPQGHELIVHDFDQMYLTNVTLNLEKWQYFMDIIIKYSTFNAKDDETNLMLEVLKNESTLPGNYLLFSLIFMLNKR
jgi:hypothetical protein